MSIRAEITPPWNQSEPSARPSSSRQGSRISTVPSSARTSSSPMSRWNGERSTLRCPVMAASRGGAAALHPRSPPLHGSRTGCRSDRRGSSLRLERRKLGRQALELGPVELASAAKRQPIEEEDAARVRVRRAALEEEALDLLLVRRGSGITGDDVGDRRLALGCVLRWHHTGVLEPG